MLLILLIASGTVLETLFIMRSYKKRDASSVFLKTVASVMFVLIGLLMWRDRKDSSYAGFIVLGLLFGLIGDFLLALRFPVQKLHTVFFVTGTLAFFIGHVFYVLAVLSLSPGAWVYAIPVTLVALGVACFYSYAKEVHAGKLTPIGVIYIGTVIFMACCSLTGAFLSSSRALFMFFLGGLCFALSDNMLVVLSFGKNDNPYRNAVLHVLYYMAQILIALSIQFL